MAGVNNNCLLCDRSCTDCGTDIYTCNTCSAGFVFLSSSPGPCVSICPVGTFFDTSDCTTCPTGCAVCFGGGTDGSSQGTQCTVCTGSYYLAIGSTKCVGTCPGGQIAGVNNNCLFCDVSCATCQTNQYTCTACNNGYYFLSGNPGVCVNSCPNGKYKGTTTCTSCPGGCQLCFGGGVDGNGKGV